MSTTPPTDKEFTKSERWQYEAYKQEHIQALEDYHEFGKAPIGSPERMAAYVSQLSLHNLKQGAEVLREWKEAAVREARIDELHLFSEAMKGQFETRYDAEKFSAHGQKRLAALQQKEEKTNDE